MNVLMVFGQVQHIVKKRKKNKIMKKLLKIICTILGITVAGSVIYKERDTIADLQKRLFEMRHFTVKKK